MDLLLLHGALMAIAWMLLLPAGVLIARFFKVTRGQNWPSELDNPLWWNAHRWLNYTGIALATVGFFVIWTVQDGLHLTGWHGLLGLTATVLGWLQVIVAWLRGSKGGPTDVGADPEDPSTWRGDHFDMTPRRRRFEAWHKQAGYLALALAVPTVWLGLDMIGASPWLRSLPWLAALLFLFLFYRFTREGRWIDTHEAIWGPDMSPETRPDRRKKREVS